MTNDTTDDAIDNTKDGDRDDDNLAAEDSPSAGADEDCPDTIDESIVSAAAASSPRVSAEIIRQLAALIADSWLKLATRLHFEQDDIVYFQTANKLSPTAQATNMLTLWTVSSYKNKNNNNNNNNNNTFADRHSAVASEAHLP